MFSSGHLSRDKTAEAFSYDYIGRELVRDLVSEEKVEQTLKLPPGKSLKGSVREDFEIVRIKTDVLKSDLIIKIN